jgi:hypothetical protein
LILQAFGFACSILNMLRLAGLIADGSIVIKVFSSIGGLFFAAQAVNFSRKIFKSKSDYVRLAYIILGLTISIMNNILKEQNYLTTVLMSLSLTYNFLTLKLKHVVYYNSMGLIGNYFLEADYTYASIVTRLYFFTMMNTFLFSSGEDINIGIMVIRKFLVPYRNTSCLENRLRALTPTIIVENNGMLHARSSRGGVSTRTVKVLNKLQNSGVLLRSSDYYSMADFIQGIAHPVVGSVQYLFERQGYTKNKDLFFRVANDLKNKVLEYKNYEDEFPNPNSFYRLVSYLCVNMSKRFCFPKGKKFPDVLIVSHSLLSLRKWGRVDVLSKTVEYFKERNDMVIGQPLLSKEETELKQNLALKVKSGFFRNKKQIIYNLKKNGVSDFINKMKSLYWNSVSGENFYLNRKNEGRLNGLLRKGKSQDIALFFKNVSPVLGRILRKSRREVFCYHDADKNLTLSQFEEIVNDAGKIHRAKQEVVKEITERFKDQRGSEENPIKVNKTRYKFCVKLRKHLKKGKGLNITDQAVYNDTIQFCPEELLDHNYDEYLKYVGQTKTSRTKKLRLHYCGALFEFRCGST